MYGNSGENMSIRSTLRLVSFAAARARITQNACEGREHCVTPARATAKETTLCLNSMINHFCPTLSWKSMYDYWNSSLNLTNQNNGQTTPKSNHNQVHTTILAAKCNIEQHFVWFLVKRGLLIGYSMSSVSNITPDKNVSWFNTRGIWMESKSNT